MLYRISRDEWINPDNIQVIQHISDADTYSIYRISFVNKATLELTLTTTEFQNFTKLMIKEGFMMPDKQRNDKDPHEKRGKFKDIYVFYE